MNVLAAGVAAVALASAPVELHVVARPVHVRIGEWLEVEVSGTLPDGVASVNAAFPPRLGAFEILDSQPLPSSVGSLRWKLRLIAFEAGTLTLPPLTFRGQLRDGRGTVEWASPPLEVEVRDVILGPGAELRSARPPVTPPLGWTEWLGLAGLLAATTGGLVRAVRRQGVPATQRVTPGLPPREKALRELRRLEERIPVRPERLDEHYGQVVAVIRGFLSEAAGLPAFHMTSGQLAEQAFAGGAAAREAMKQLSSSADSVRFGGAALHPNGQQRDLAAAKTAVSGWRATPDLRDRDALG